MTGPQRTDGMAVINDWFNHPSVELVYPETKTVTPSWVITQAIDAYHNKKIDAWPETLKHAIDMLDDAGLITVRKPRAT